MEFEARLVTDAPPLAKIFEVESVAINTSTGFRIVQSRAEGPMRTFVSPDIATCDDCLQELFDPLDRRARYPFINCTNCGPRFTITERVPYDRPNTTMAGFTLCPSCRAEYHDSDDRRFHAQPVACEACGPRLWFEGAGGHLSTAPTPPSPPRRLRWPGARSWPSKGWAATTWPATPPHHAPSRHPAAAQAPRGQALRGHGGRPGAVLRALARIGAGRDCAPGQPGAPHRPARPATGSGVADQVAPGHPQIGLLLPYTPLHHLLFRAGPRGRRLPALLVMTSGNLTDEPICYDDGDARRRLARLADGWLVHDRAIHVPCDDSVVRVDDGVELPIRRSRGYAPLPVRLPFEVAPLLAMGGELKNTFCLASGRHAWVSQHIGDMGSLETLAAFERSVGQFGEMYQVAAKRVVADAHPGYQSRRWADDRSGRPVELVQHHHAHIAAVMVEHGVPAGQQVLGYAFDGTGYGSDGAIWGGEVLIAGYDGFDRAAHLRYVPLPGGDTTVRKPYRAALAYLWAAGIAWAPDLPPVRRSAPSRAGGAAAPARARRALRAHVEHGPALRRRELVAGAPAPGLL